MLVIQIKLNFVYQFCHVINQLLVYNGLSYLPWAFLQLFHSVICKQWPLYYLLSNIIPSYFIILLDLIDIWLGNFCCNWWKWKNIWCFIIKYSTGCWFVLISFRNHVLKSDVFFYFYFIKCGKCRTAELKILDSEAIFTRFKFNLCDLKIWVITEIM